MKNKFIKIIVLALIILAAYEVSVVLKGNVGIKKNHEGKELYRKDKYEVEKRLKVKERKVNKSIDEEFTYQSIPEEIKKKMIGLSWHENNNISLDDLSYIKVLHWGFDNKIHKGELVVHNKVSKEIVDIFKELYYVKYPIDKIKIIDEYEANDKLSMEDNNTSAFCYRNIASGSNNISKHAYGVAIDINPVQNPYINKDKILPISSKDYIDRSNVRKGMIVKDDALYLAFKKRGWIWGGEWKYIKDYQHFEKNIDY
ncbi:D-alanyl-D-alanine carboxypeptidase [Gottschalkia purinilytica]|uniref:D-alanyl-D-alanine carboxypeptidase n=1 Tax=Gottschalkia purinilytica TaxID=1503 RepID=A0A0L0WF40_GOTPU|nr:M15 family metallopeptidase [Gottschalkia purinilytica]KNF10035.1 D-alanyl-D-alanine carboxypeptidase [Gottschalkia purinilytica]